jgi:hypothetical protein
MALFDGFSEGVFAMPTGCVTIFPLLFSKKKFDTSVQFFIASKKLIYG